MAREVHQWNRVPSDFDHLHVVGSLPDGVWDLPGVGERLVLRNGDDHNDDPLLRRYRGLRRHQEMAATARIRSYRIRAVPSGTNDRTDHRTGNIRLPHGEVSLQSDRKASDCEEYRNQGRRRPVLA